MTTPEDQHVLFERQGGIGIITLNRPETMNAMSSGVMVKILDYVHEMEEDETAKVIVLTANGRGFCSGMDVSDATTDVMQRKRPSSVWPRPRPEKQPVNILRNSPLPVVGAINGTAAGAGMSLALAPDIRIASERAKFIPLFLKRGLQPDMGASYLMVKALGAQKTLELVWSAETITAEQALELGLVSKVVPHDHLMPTALELAERLAKGPSVAIALAKRAVYRAESGTLDLDLELGTFSQERLMKTEDFIEGWKSFAEKREANFKGH